MIYTPVFVTFDRETGKVTGMFEPSAVDHHNFRMVYGIVRDYHPHDSIKLYARTSINGADLITGPFTTLRD